MFFRKKKEETKPTNIYDLMCDDKVAKVDSTELRKSVNRVFTALRAVDTYPEGPEKEKAKNFLEKTQRTMMRDYHAYNAVRQEALDFYNNNWQYMDEYSYSLPPSIPDAKHIIEQESQRYRQG